MGRERRALFPNERIDFMRAIEDSNIKLSLSLSFSPMCSSLVEKERAALCVY
jgi:hypothetical protein